MKYISLIGSTGSIGQQTLDVVASCRDRLGVAAIASGSRNLELLAQQVAMYQPELVCVPTAQDALELAGKPEIKSLKTEIVHGEDGLVLVATHSRAAVLVTGVVGFLGLKPTLAAIRQRKVIALANKETLVAAGSVVMPLARKHGVKIIPVDSEHSAIFQALAGAQSVDGHFPEMHRIWLTASGGPFRTWTAEQLRGATVSDALKHPNWTMGSKITVDSATLMNKGLEIIEARWLFNVSADQIKVVIHPQSILHSAVEFIDGSIIGQFGLPDMHLPIHYALFYPDRAYSHIVPRFNFIEAGSLTFAEPDIVRFPCLDIAQKIAASADTSACVLNAANEIAVKMFLERRIKFHEIANCILQVLDKHNPISKPQLEDILEADRWARQETLNQIGTSVV